MSEVEHTVKTLQITPNLQAEIHALEAEGWQLVPGVLPVIVYHLVRQKNAPAVVQGALGQIKVDETKVHILRDGKLI